ncbi:MAG TPA: hypothetical protein VGM80_01850 [Gaiellaceae bacterium]
MQATARGAPGLALPPTRVSRAAASVGRTLGRIDLLTARIPPWMVLVPLAVLGWLVVAFVARVAVHSGPLYYNGGDATWYYTTSWMLGNGHIPYASIGYGYSMLLAPFARIAGPNMVAGLPYAIAINVLVLGPIALCCIYGLAKEIAGRRYAYLVSLVWTVAPLLAIPYFVLRYHRRYVGETLPAVLGLTTLGDFPSMVALLVSAYFAFRAISSGRGSDALTSGLAAGLALAIKPSNGAFLPALVVAFALARRPRALMMVAAGLAPALVCLTLWKDRGLGHVPLFTSSAQAYALGSGSPPLGLSTHLNSYIRFNWHSLTQNIDGLREYTWSKRMIEWSLVGGAIGLTRRSLAGGALLAVWLASYVLVKGSSVATVTGGNFFRYLAPAFPAAFLLAASVPLLLPIAGRKLAAAGTTNGWPNTNRSRNRVLGVAAFLSVAPLIPLLAFPVQSTASAAALPNQSLFVPVHRFDLKATAKTGDAVSLSWTDQAVHGARVKYEIFRARADQLYCNPQSGGAAFCTFPDHAIHATTAPHWTDVVPRPGTWVYRIVLATAVPPPIGIGDAIMLSEPLTVEVTK